MDGAVRKKFLRLHLIRGFHIDEFEVRDEGLQPVDQTSFNNGRLLLRKEYKIRAYEVDTGNLKF